MNRSFFEELENGVTQALEKERTEFWENVAERGLDPNKVAPPAHSFIDFIDMSANVLGLNSLHVYGEMDRLNHFSKVGDTSVGMIILLLNAWAIGTPPSQFFLAPEVSIGAWSDEILGIISMTPDEREKDEAGNVIPVDFGIVDDMFMKTHHYFGSITFHFPQEVRFLVSRFLSLDPSVTHNLSDLDTVTQSLWGINVTSLEEYGSEIRMQMTDARNYDAEESDEEDAKEETEEKEG